MNIDLKQIQALLRLLEKRGVNEFEFEDENIRLRLVRGVASSALPGGVPHIVAAPAPVAPERAATPASEEKTKDDFITSPFVGTFYGAPGPDKPPFVTPGAQFSAGQTMCIIEAMKLMNEIEAEYAGIVDEVLVTNGQPVEFGTKLFRVRKL